MKNLNFAYVAVAAMLAILAVTFGMVIYSQFNGMSAAPWDAFKLFLHAPIAILLVCVLLLLRAAFKRTE